MSNILEQWVGLQIVGSPGRVLFTCLRSIRPEDLISKYIASHNDNFSTEDWFIEIHK